MQNSFSRRNFLGALTAGTFGVAASELFSTTDSEPAFGADAPNPEREIIGDPRVRGPFPILSTPFFESGEVDYETLAGAIGELETHLAAQGLKMNADTFRASRFLEYDGAAGIKGEYADAAEKLLTIDYRNTFVVPTIE